MKFSKIQKKMIRLILVSWSMLILCEFVYSQDVISKGKPATQTGNYQNKYPASLCVDGNLNNFCHTSLDGNPFWMVDLEGLYTIDSVVLYNRVDCCQSRIVGVIVELLSKTNELIHQCGKIIESKPSYVISCGNKIGNKIRVRHTKNEFLHFRDLEVKGVSFKSTSESRINIAKGKVSFLNRQSHNQFPAALCNDGKFDNFCHTTQAVNSSWTVDLAGTFNIQSLVLHNRKDCCSERIVGTVIELLNKNDEISDQCGIVKENKPTFTFSCDGKLAAKIRVKQTQNQILNFAELEVYGEVEEELLVFVIEKK